MHPSVCALRRITGLRYPHHTAHAEACLHSATAAPAPSRFLRPQAALDSAAPYRGSLSSGSAPQSLPCKGRCRRRRRRGAAPGPAIILSGRRSPCVGADALHRPASLRHRKAHGTMQASSPTKHRAGFCRGFAGYLPPQGGNAPSVCALRRIQLPLQGSLSSGSAPQSLPCKGRCRRRRRRGAAPGPATTLPDRRSLRRGRCFASARKFAPSQGPKGRCKHRPLRSTGQGSARLCRISPSARRQCTPQSAPCGASSSPYRGAFQAAAPRKASPAREGAAAAQKQPRTGALGAGLFCRDAGGPFGGQRPADSGVSVSETAASGVAGGASASSPRRHSRCSSSGICSAAQVPSSCCVISSSISS